MVVYLVFVQEILEQIINLKIGDEYMKKKGLEEINNIMLSINLERENKLID